jgi:hypothetical protein
MSGAVKGKCPQRRKAPKISELAAPRKTELIGLTDDGRMVLWDTGMVRPISRFESDGRFIKSGHYVIEWKGHAITVHCGNQMRGARWGIGVLFMCSDATSVFMDQAEVEPLLIGEVVRDPESERRIVEAFERIREADRQWCQAPHLQRGRIG